MERKKIQELVKTTRTQQGLSQSAFADSLSKGLPRKIRKQDVSKWENGRTIPEFWFIYILLFAPGDDWRVRMARAIFDEMQSL